MTKSWQQKNGSEWLIRGWFIFTALAAGICLYRLAVIGETSLHSVFLGYSASRLLMMAGALLWCLIGPKTIMEIYSDCPGARSFP